MTSAISTRRRRSLTPVVAPWLFVLPAVIFFIGFLLLPIGYAIWLSFQDYRVAGGAYGVRQQVFVGFSNYTAALTDPEFLSGFGRVLLYACIAIPTVLGFALAFALLLDSPAVRAKGFARTAIFLPYAVPGVIASLLWGFLYLPSTSPISYVTQRLGAGPVPFLSDPQLYFALANISLWAGVGFNMIIIYTALRALPTEIYEAARIDGASELAIAFRIKIPLVAPALVLTGLFSVIGTFQLYSEPATLQPITTTISSTWVPLMKIYQLAFSQDSPGPASAASVLLALLILGLSAIILGVLQRRTFGGEE